jgi:hypothetical protein
MVCFYGTKASHLVGSAVIAGLWTGCRLARFAAQSIGQTMWCEAFHLLTSSVPLQAPSASCARVCNCVILARNSSTVGRTFVVGGDLRFREVTDPRCLGRRPCINSTSSQEVMWSGFAAQPLLGSLLDYQLAKPQLFTRLTTHPEIVPFSRAFLPTYSATSLVLILTRVYILGSFSVLS